MKTEDRIVALLRIADRPLRLREIVDIVGSHWWRGPTGVLVALARLQRDGVVSAMWQNAGPDEFRVFWLREHGDAWAIDALREMP